MSCVGISSSGVVTLESIQIFRTHELLMAPTVYFSCQGQNKTLLPDIRKKNTLYTFKGEESWQPLAEFLTKKCKRCGFYERDVVLSDDVFDEWEFCPSDFTAPNGEYIRFKDKEFNATFYCPDCVPLGKVRSLVSRMQRFNWSRLITVCKFETDGCPNWWITGWNHTSGSDNGETKGKGRHLALVIFVTAVASTGFIIGAVVSYRYWLRKKRMEDRARFLKLFDDVDDIEDEMGLG
ncbi:hypothetical protein C5167_007834 [Papaver somniferum]|nr:hypothetical protein C5167_007834 [Papaver somniferum]